MGFKKIVCKECGDLHTIHSGECDLCGHRMTPVFPNEKYNVQYEGSLVVSFDGGYGMYVDNYEHAMVLICKECADKFLEKNPEFRRIVKDGK
jgi:hypothetical protein